MIFSKAFKRKSSTEKKEKKEKERKKEKKKRAGNFLLKTVF